MFLSLSPSGIHEEDLSSLFEEF